ncbi:MAG: bacterial transcriptional activator domain-containing protein [Anaerolineae bacterium]|nr:bacterial transcriptional activator domain-containing protein [Anaerolineae bacterium]
MQAESQIQSITGLNVNDVESFVRDKSVILFAPRFRNRNALMTWFTSFGTEAYFHTLDTSDTTLIPFLSNLVDKFRDFDGNFGKQTTQALNTASVTVDDCVDALVADLTKAKPKPTFIILDSFDYLQPSEDVTAFFLKLVSKLPKGMQLVINSRDLPAEPWSTLVRNKKAVVLGDEKSLDGGIFDPNKPDTAHLEVYGLAGGNVYVNGLPLTTWDGPLPKHLFYYFVDHPMVTRDEIFDTFWPDLPTKEATNVFHVTKRKISERLGFELTAYSGGFYRPSGQMDVHYDVRNFETLLGTISFEDEELAEVPPEWYSAIHLYRTPFLTRLDMPWIERRRQQIKQNYVGILIGIGRIYKALNDTDNAITYYLRALREYPEREDVHRELMGMYASRRDIDKAVEQYKMLTSILKRTLNISPSKTTRQFYKSIVGSDPS